MLVRKDFAMQDDSVTVKLTQTEFKVIKNLRSLISQSPYGRLEVLIREGRVIQIRPTPYINGIEEKKGG